MDKVKTGILIREARKKKNYTQSELGDLLGVTNKAVSRWENGEAFPDVGVLEQLSNLLDLKIQDLVTGEIQTREMNPEDTMAELVRLSKIQLHDKKKKIVESVFWIGLLLLDLAMCAIVMGGSDDSIYHGMIIACILLTAAGILRQAMQYGTEPLGNPWYDRFTAIFPIASMIVVYIIFAIVMTAIQNGVRPFGLADPQIGPFMMTFLYIGFWGNLIILFVSCILWLKGSMGARWGHILSSVTMFTCAMLGNTLHRMTSWETMVVSVIWDIAIPLFAASVAIILLRILLRHKPIAS